MYVCIPMYMSLYVSRCVYVFVCKQMCIWSGQTRSVKSTDRPPTYTTPSSLSHVLSAARLYPPLLICLQDHQQQPTPREWISLNVEGLVAEADHSVSHLKASNKYSPAGRTPIDRPAETGQPVFRVSLPALLIMLIIFKPTLILFPSISQSTLSCLEPS